MGSVITNKKQDKCLALKIGATALVVFFLGYSIVNGTYYSGSGAITRIGIVAVLYAAMIALIWVKNRLSEKTNLIASFIVCAVTPFICYALVECANSGWSCLFVEGAGLSLKMHLLNGMIYVFFELFIFGLTSSLRVSSIASYVFFGLLGAAQHYICLFRGMGFVASDFYSISAAKEVAAAYDFNPDYWMFISLSLVLLGVIMSISFSGKLKTSKKSRLIFLLIAVMSATGFYITYFKLPFTRDMKVKLYKPQETYTKKGSMFTFVRSFRYLVIDKPEGYSPERAQEIADKYSSIEQADNNISVDETPNLILIMNESLCDVEDLGNGKIKLNQDGLPVIHGLKEDTIKATLFEERRGGGTSIMEFEALTGCTNAFFPIGTMAYQTVIKTDTPSLASQLAGDGYQGVIASHPHSGKGYNRTAAYPLLGFKEMKFKPDFISAGHNKKYGRYISDAAAYEEIIEEFEASTNKTDEPFFAFQVTMQNHAPYDSAKTDDIKIVSKDTYNESVEQYLNYAYTSDKEIGNLIDYFKTVEDPTLLVVFGDHAPRFDTSYYKQVLGIEDELTDEQEMNFQKTPMIMWANYDIKEENLGNMSDNYISMKIIELLGIEETGYQKYLRELQKKIPVINSLGYWGNDGNYYAIDDKESPFYEDVLEYNILVYNELVDVKNTVKDFFN